MRRLISINISHIRSSLALASIHSALSGNSSFIPPQLVSVFNDTGSGPSGDSYPILPPGSQVSKKIVTTGGSGQNDYNFISFTNPGWEIASTVTPGSFTVQAFYIDNYNPFLSGGFFIGGKMKITGPCDGLLTLHSRSPHDDPIIHPSAVTISAPISSIYISLAATITQEAQPGEDECYIFWPQLNDVSQLPALPATLDTIADRFILDI